MWAITMVVMMLPSAAPTILLVTALGGDRTAPAAVPFAPIYLLVWIGFSVAATAPQFGLDRSPAGTGCHQRTLSVWIRDMPPREAYRQTRQLLATFRFDCVPCVGAEHVQLVISPCVPCRLAREMLVLFHLRSISGLVQDWLIQINHRPACAVRSLVLARPPARPSLLRTHADGRGLLLRSFPP
jgi:hypothetical protein